MTSRDLLLENLKNLVSDLELAKKQLMESYDACSQVGLKPEYARIELVEFEALSGRFARVSDLLLQKLFRAVDAVELTGGGTLIDALNRAQKRNLIDSQEQMYSIRELRNWVVHEYLPKGLQDLFSDLLQKTPLLIHLIERTLGYAESLVSKA